MLRLFQLIFFAFFWGDALSSFKCNYDLADGGYRILICIGEPCQYARVLLDVQSRFNFLSSSYYNEKESNQSVISGMGMIENDTYVYDIVSDKVSIESSKDNQDKNKSASIPLMPFYVYRKPNLYLLRGISLGFSHLYSSYESKRSLLHQLEREEYITEKVFALSKPNNHEGYVFFGKLPDEVLRSHRHQLFCEVDPNNGWGCPLSLVKIGEEEFTVGENFSISTRESKTYVPYKFFNEVFKEKIMKKYFDNLGCISMSYGKNEDVFCKCNMIEDFPDLTFVVKGYQFVYPKEKSFSMVGNTCIFTFEAREIYEKKFILGTRLINEFLLVFNYENQTLSFLSETPFSLYTPPKIQKKIYFRKKLLMNFILLSCIIGIIISLSIKKSLKS